jgi:hypothetical protein
LILINKMINEYLQSINHSSKKRINIAELENVLINMFQSSEEYRKNGGYDGFSDCIQKLKGDGILVPMKKNSPNGRNPTLPLNWWYIPPTVKGSWEPIEMLKMSDKLNLIYFKSNPSLQTDKEWMRIKSVYHFLNNCKNKLVISREERSLELFDDEKFLSETTGRTFLSRLGINLEDLKAEIHGEPFVFWLQPGVELMDIQTVLIVENKSFFHTCVKLMRKNQLVLNPQLVIYGEGKHIEKSFAFFYEMFPKKAYDIYYAGDIDPEGWGIYYRLSQNFSKAKFQLAIPIYNKMVEFLSKIVEVEHQKNEIHLDFVIKELQVKGSSTLVEVIQMLWTQNKRIPQEVLTIETFSKGDRNE